ncbi:hypothetical protein D3C87_1931530 [compost metagenome]
MRSPLPAAIFALYWLAINRKPSSCGLVLNSFRPSAQVVQSSSHIAGTTVTQMYLVRFIFTRTTVPSTRATAASIWLEMPNSGHRLFTPPSGSTTP